MAPPDAGTPPPAPKDRKGAVSSMTDHDDAELVAYLKAYPRIVSVEEQARLTAIHDAEDLTPLERAAYDTGSMHTLELS